MIASILAMTQPALAQGVLKQVDAVIVNPTSKPVPVTIVGAARTHQGVPVADHVVLVWVATGATTACGDSNSEFRRLNPNGSFDSASFVAPAGRTFVVTDVDAVIVSGLSLSSTGFELGNVVYASIGTPGNFNSSLVPFVSNGVPITSANTRAVAMSSTLGAGVAFAAGQQVCIRGVSQNYFGAYIFPTLTTGTVRGYLL